MQRRLILGLVGALSSSAWADDADVLDAELGDQGVGASVGLAMGGRSTPGGARLAGHYTYQLSSTDWFDGTAAFTFGGGSAECFRDREDNTICDHGVADGAGVELIAAVRRYYEPQGKFRPFLRGGIGFTLQRFGADDVSGFGVPLHGGAGVRAVVSDGIAISAMADLAVGLAKLGRVGAEPLASLAITAGVEFRLR